VNIPDWLVSVIYKCLRKKPENRFKNGQELHEFIIHSGIQTFGENASMNVNALQDNFQRLVKERDHLQQKLVQYNDQIKAQEKELEDLRTIVNNNKNIHITSPSSKNGVSKTSFFAVVFLSIGLAVFSAYSLIKSNLRDTQQLTQSETNSSNTKSTANNSPIKKVNPKKESAAVKKPPKTDSALANDTTNNLKQRKKAMVNATGNDKSFKDTQQVKQLPRPVSSKATHQYMVTSKAYFYNSPDESTRRNAFVVPSNNAIVNAFDEKDSFVYVVFTNQLGQTSKGWLRKQDLQLLNE
jgi:serine/threonine-protein kinase